MSSGPKRWRIGCRRHAREGDDAGEDDAGGHKAANWTPFRMNGRWGCGRMGRMDNPKGIDWTHVTCVTGQRQDRLPASLPPQLFTRPCGNCAMDTYTEVEYPADVPLLCNVCAATIAAEAEDDPETLLLYDLPEDVKAHLTVLAHQRGVPPEVQFKEFLEWKLGRPIKATLSHPPDKKK